MNYGAAFADGLRAALGVPAIVYALAASGLNLQYGFGGLINVGQVGFLLVGAYGTAISASHGVPLVLAVLIGIAAAVVLGLIMGLPTLRLRADYLAIATLSFAEILRLVVRSRPLERWTGGVFGIRGFAGDFFAWNPIPPGRYGVGNVAFNHRNLWVVTVGWVVVALVAIVVRLLVRSPWGRLVRAIRDDEDAVRSVGKPVFALKLQVLVLGGVIGAAGGILLAIDTQFVDPDFWVLAITTYALTAMSLGGTGTVIGPIVGAMFFWFVVQALDTLMRQGFEDSFLGSHLTPTDAGPIRFALVGLVLMLVMIFRPQGAFGDREDLGVAAR